MIQAKIDNINMSEINEKGMQALKNALGVVGTIRFLQQYDNGGTGDYTAEKYLDNKPEPTDEEIRKMFGLKV